MKKGDEIQKRQDIPKGKSLMHGYVTLEKAMHARNTIGQWYDLPGSVQVRCGVDDVNPGKFAVIADEDTYMIVKARVNWIVDNEVGITYLDSGGAAVLDIAEDTGWIVIKSAPLSYQSDVEHMSDDDLRASIERLRATRVSQPQAVKRGSRGLKVKEPPMSAQDKALTGVLAGLDPEAKLALQRKLGLVE